MQLFWKGRERETGSHRQGQVLQILGPAICVSGDADIFLGLLGEPDYQRGTG